MAKTYRGYYIHFNHYENCYQVRTYIGGRSVVIARRESEGEAQMFIDDTIDGTNKEEEYEQKQIK